MSVFIDTSTLLAVLDADDQFHEAAAATWRSLIQSGEDLLVTSYVLLEVFALVQHRLGLQATRTLAQDVAPTLRVEWLAEHEHREAVTAVLSANRRDLSLVDCASFLIMRQQRITRAFTFDQHFAEQGFETITQDDG